MPRATTPSQVEHLPTKANPNAEYPSYCLTYVVLLDAPSHLQHGQTLNKTKGEKKSTDSSSIQTLASAWKNTKLFYIN